MNEETKDLANTSFSFIILGPGNKSGATEVRSEGDGRSLEVGGEQGDGDSEAEEEGIMDDLVKEWSNRLGPNYVVKVQHTSDNCMYYVLYCVHLKSTTPYHLHIVLFIW